MSYLFNKFPVRGMFEKMLRLATAEVQKLGEEEVLNSDPDQIVKRLVDRFRFEFPQLDESRIEQDVEVLPTSSALVQYQVSYSIPFTGEREVLGFIPVTPPTSSPTGVVRGDEIVVRFLQLDRDEGRFRGNFDRNLRMIKGYLSALQSDAEKGFEKLSFDVKALIAVRRGQLERAGKMRKNLGYPLRMRADAAQVAVPLTRKEISLEEPLAPLASATPEPYLLGSAFNDILKVLSAMSVVMERNPTTFSRIEEQAIRDHFLVQLNGQFEGKASGETFNAAGKTGILLREGDRNIFMAECKFWDGPQSLIDAITQLFSYLTWRDTKAVLLVFSRRLGFSQVVEAAKAGLEAHALRRQPLQSIGQTEFRTIMARSDDEQRHIALVVLLFDVPSPTSD